MTDTFPLQLINRLYAAQDDLRSLLIIHSKAVADKALSIIEQTGIPADPRFTFQAAMLHDIGIIHCNAPKIFCHGTMPYICHGTEGRAILDQAGYPLHALVCERHTGSGLTVDDIISQALPLPHRDMTPQSIEEKLICYADKFFSKSSTPREEKPFDRVCSEMQRHGDDSLQRFLDLHRLFSRE